VNVEVSGGEVTQASWPRWARRAVSCDDQLAGSTLNPSGSLTYFAGQGGWAGRGAAHEL